MTNLRAKFNHNTRYAGTTQTGLAKLRADPGGVLILRELEHNNGAIRAVTNSGEALSFDDIARKLDTPPDVHYRMRSYELNLPGYVLQGRLAQHAFLDSIAPFTTNTISRLDLPMVQVHTEGLLQPDVRRQLAGFEITFPENRFPSISLREMVNMADGYDESRNRLSLLPENRPLRPFAAARAALNARACAGHGLYRQSARFRVNSLGPVTGSNPGRSSATSGDPS